MRSHCSYVMMISLWIYKSGNTSDGLLLWLSGKESACKAGDLGSTPGSGRSPGVGNGNWLQHSCLENSMDRGAWWATVQRVTKSDTTVHTHTHVHTYLYIHIYIGFEFITNFLKYFTKKSVFITWGKKIQRSSGIAHKGQTRKAVLQ